MHVLLVKLTSMGDLIHALPALTDAYKNIPGIKFDWVIDENFSEIASWHPAVDRIIPSAHRRWRKSYWKFLNSGELKQFYCQLTARKYDLVIDGQTSYKSVIMAKLAKGRSAGLDVRSSRELGVGLLYNHKIFVDKKEHAIKRLRLLFAKALNYPYQDSVVDFAIERSKFQPCPIALPDKYLLFIHNASWESKLWPEPYWQQLNAIAHQQGYHTILPWGNEVEHQRAQRIAADNDMSLVLPKLNLSQVATVINKARGAVCVDTGLSHLVAALNIPAVTLYGATNPELIKATGESQIHLQAKFSCSPCYRSPCAYKKSSQHKPACFDQLTPAVVWENLQTLL